VGPNAGSADANKRWCVAVTATDQAGNAGSNTICVEITRTNTPPVLTVISPARTTVTGPTAPVPVELRFQTDGVNPPFTHRCEIDGAMVADPCTPGQVVVVAPGSHQLTVRALDQAGSSAVDQVPFFVQTESEPGMVIAMPLDGSVTSDPNVRLVLEAGPAYQGLLAFDLETAQCSKNGAPFTLCRGLLEAGPFEEGVQTLVVRAYDQNGVLHEATTTFTIDNNEPPAA
jgi:hypothetical protein